MSGGHADCVVLALLNDGSQYLPTEYLQQSGIQSNN